MRFNYYFFTFLSLIAFTEKGHGDFFRKNSGIFCRAAYSGETLRKNRLLWKLVLFEKPGESWIEFEASDALVKITVKAKHYSRIWSSVYKPDEPVRISVEVKDTHNTFLGSSNGTDEASANLNLNVPVANNQAPKKLFVSCAGVDSVDIFGLRKDFPEFGNNWDRPEELKNPDTKNFPEAPYFAQYVNSVDLIYTQKKPGYLWGTRTNQRYETISTRCYLPLSVESFRLLTEKVYEDRVTEDTPQIKSMFHKLDGICNTRVRILSDEPINDQSQCKINRRLHFYDNALKIYPMNQEYYDRFQQALDPQDGSSLDSVVLCESKGTKVKR